MKLVKEPVPFSYEEFEALLNERIEEKEQIERMIWLYEVYFYVLGLYKVQDLKMFENKDDERRYREIFKVHKKKRSSTPTYDPLLLEDVFVCHAGVSRADAEAFTCAEEDYMMQIGLIES